MRNPDRTLDRSESAMVATRVRQFSAVPAGVAVTVEYVKRDGQAGKATGPVERVTPNGSKGIVVVDTTASKGRPSSVNLYNVTKVTVHK